jgi:hypothetical protein
MAAFLIGQPDQQRQTAAGARLSAITRAVAVAVVMTAASASSKVALRPSRGSGDRSLKGDQALAPMARMLIGNARAGGSPAQVTGPYQP